MEKNTAFNATNVQPSAPLPTAPPSYEEAIANAGGAPAQLPIASPPYPVGAVSSVPMPMPMPYNQSSNQTRPTSSVHVNTSQSLPQICSNVERNTAPQPQQMRVIYQHVITHALGPNPVKMSCPTCHADIKSTTISDHQPSAHICCIVLCLLGCCLCSCLPYCMSAFMSVHHFCPNCKNYIGTWKG